MNGRLCRGIRKLARSFYGIASSLQLRYITRRYVCHEKLVSSLVSSIFKTLITLLDLLSDSRTILLQSLISCKDAELAISSNCVYFLSYISITWYLYNICF